MVNLIFVLVLYTDKSSCLTVHVLSFSKCCSVVVAKCKICHDNTTSPQPCEPLEGASLQGGSMTEQKMVIGRVEGMSNDKLKTVTVLFSLQCAKFIGISVGSFIQIHPPWYVYYLFYYLCYHLSCWSVEGSRINPFFVIAGQ